MKFDPITESEWNMPGSMVKPGEVDFMITDVTEGIGSQSGIPLLKLELECTQGSNSISIKDNLSSSPKAKWKITQFLKSIPGENLKEKGLQGELIHGDIINKQGKAILKKEEYKDRNTGEPRSCLKVDYYIPYEDHQLSHPRAVPRPGSMPLAEHEPEIDDEIPF